MSSRGGSGSRGDRDRDHRPRSRDSSRERDRESGTRSGGSGSGGSHSHSSSGHSHPHHRGGGGGGGDRDRSTTTTSSKSSSSQYIKEKPTISTSTSSSSSSSKVQTVRTNITTTTTSKSSASSALGTSSSTSGTAEKSRLKPPPALKASTTTTTTTAKRRESIDSEDSGATDEEAPVVLKFDKFQLYEQVCSYEGVLAEEMDVRSFVCNFLEDCNELADLVEFLYETRQNAETKEDLQALVNSEEFNEVEDDCCLQVAQLRRNNRLLKLRVKAEKDALLEQRQAVDRDHLKLQNLLYEAIHLKKQIAAVKDYKSIDERIQLVPLEEFYANAPPSISKPEITKNDPHRLRIARLEYEFYQRRQLTKNCVKLEESKQKITKQIGVQKTKLNSFKPLLDEILKSTVPAQKFFDKEYTTKAKMYKAASFLPAPLYALYVNSVGYKEFLGKLNFKFNIAGNITAAKKLLRSEGDREKKDQEIQEDSDHEMDVDEVETVDKEEESDRRALRKHSSVIEEQQEKRRKILEAHPLNLEWLICDENGRNSLTIKFFYLTNLKIITVQTAIILADMPESAQTLITNFAETLLCDIYDHDDGTSSPNPSTSYFLNKAGLDTFKDITSLVGRPFSWAQKLCGLSFPNAGNDEFEKNEEESGSDNEEEDKNPESSPPTIPKQTMVVSSANLDSTFKRINRRFRCSQYLWTQLKTLETRSISIPPELKEQFPIKNTTMLTSWEPIDWDKYSKYAGASGAIKFDMVHSRNRLFFKGSFERSRAKVLALIAISFDYPIEPPIFILQFDPSSGFPIIPGDETILREMEKEINLYTVEEFENWSSQILSLQVQRLIYCVDLFLETRTDDSAEGPSEFGREKLFSQPSKGKNFRRPFQYIGKHGGHFTQRF